MQDRTILNVAQWWRQMFDELGQEWDDLSEQNATAPAARFIGDLAKSIPGGAVLDLCCGQGRLFPALTALNRPVVGLDRSSAQITRASSRANDAAQVSLVRADMRQLPFSSQAPAFALAVRCYMSLGYVSREEERKMFAQLRKLVLPGGAVVLDSFNWDWVRERGCVSQSTQARHFEVKETYKASTESQTIECRWTYTYHDKRPTKEIVFQLLGYDAIGMAELLERSGWSSIVIYEDYSGVCVEGVSTSSRLVAVGRA